MASWTPGKDPCGAANCTAAASQGFPQYPTAVPRLAENASAGSSCQWEGISCMCAPLLSRQRPAHSCIAAQREPAL